MKNKLAIFFIIVIFLIPLWNAKGAGQNQTFRIMTQSDSGDYIGHGQSWDFSNNNNSRINSIQNTADNITFNVSNFSISGMSFAFASEAGKTLIKGLYTPAKRLAFRDSYNGIEIDGDGRGCNQILGAFYVHEYVVNNGVLEKAAIDFVQICEPRSTDINEQSPKLVGSIRYNSNIPDSCNSQGCDQARQNLGLTGAGNSQNSVIANSDQTPTNQQIVSNNQASFSSEAYKAIVKIKTYKLNDAFALSETSEGSGVILSASGLILTNDHVVSDRNDLDDSDNDTAFQICLIKQIDKKPTCDYSAKLVYKDKNKDTALLQIVNIPGISEMVAFPYLKLSATDTAQINDTVTAIGFPAIGGDTVTVTKGIISGKEEKHNNKWIKTDAIISFGSSGGAAINSKNEVIGITTKIFSDASTELGYALNSASIYSWIETYKNSTPQTSPLFKRLTDLVKKQKILEKSNKFINLVPYFSINKPTDWVFEHEMEDMVSVTNKNDNDGGMLMLHILKTAALTDLNSIKPLFLRNYNNAGLSSIIKYSKEKTIKTGNNQGKVISFLIGGKIFDIYAFPLKENIIWFEYLYKNDQDKKVIENILKSYTTSNEKTAFTEVHKFSNKSPKFSIATDSNHPILLQNDKVAPLTIFNKTNKESFVSFNIKKIDDATKNLSNEELLNAQKNEIASINQLGGSMLDYNYIINKTGTHYKLNNQIKDIIFIDGAEKIVSSNKIIALDREYWVRVGNTMIRINLTVFTDKKNIFDQAVIDFNKLLSALSLK